MILVTGGTGLVGSHLLYKLLIEGKQVRATYRRPHTLERVKHVFSYYSENYNDLFEKIIWVEADIIDIPALQKAFEGIDQVYHCAAFVSFEPDKYYELRKINIEGTANVVNLSITNNIKKLCYVSSIAAIGHTNNPDELISEETEWNTEADNSVYAITKYGAEMEVWRGTQEGLSAVVVNPGVILGPGYWKGGSSGNLFRMIYKGLKFYTSGVTGYVDVWDVVEIMVSLMNEVIENERFILVSENLSFKDFQEDVAKKLMVKPAKREATKFKLELAWRLDWLNHKLTGSRRRLSKQMAKSVRTKTIYDNSKIREFLKTEFNPVNQSIKKVTDLYFMDLKER